MKESFRTTAIAVNRRDSMKGIISLALVLTIVACGKGTDDETPATANPPEDGTTTTDPPDDGSTTTDPPVDGAKTQRVAVRVLGVHGTGSVLVRVASLDLTVDGHSFPIQLKGGELNLGNAQNAWAVTVFDLPVEANKVAIHLRFQPEGIIEHNGQTRALDLSGPPLFVVADAARLRTRSKVVFEIDLARSLVDRGAQVSLLPDFIIRY
ncbi:hypothetical protein JGU66_35940 [Myxococcaceae bacterium JPH2]|nr:hypothetical protein [Myxococcaceae bacterium JPH2]